MYDYTETSIISSLQFRSSKQNAQRASNASTGKQLALPPLDGRTVNADQLELRIHLKSSDARARDQSRTRAQNGTGEDGRRGGMRHFLHTTLTSRAKHDTRGERESSCHLHGQNPYTNLQVESAFKLIPNTAPSMLGPASRLLATNSHATSTCFTKPDQLSVACHTSTTFHDQVYLSLPKISSNSCSHSPPELSRSRFPSLPLHLPPRPPLAGSPSPVAILAALEPDLTKGQHNEQSHVPCDHPQPEWGC